MFLWWARVQWDSPWRPSWRVTRRFAKLPRAKWSSAKLQLFTQELANCGRRNEIFGDVFVTSGDLIGKFCAHNSEEALPIAIEDPGTGITRGRDVRNQSRELAAQLRGQYVWGNDVGSGRILPVDDDDRI